VKLGWKDQFLLSLKRMDVWVLDISSNLAQMNLDCFRAPVKNTSEKCECEAFEAFKKMDGAPQAEIFLCARKRLSSLGLRCIDGGENVCTRIRSETAYQFLV
jgi:hypothetical protein